MASNSRRLTRRQTTIASIAIVASGLQVPLTIWSSGTRAQPLYTRRGINLSGGEIGAPGNHRGRFGFEFTYPTRSDYRAIQELGHSFVRLPIRWERLQPSLDNPLDQSGVNHLHESLISAELEGVLVLLDLHNYAEYEPTTGPTLRFDEGISVEQFQKIWLLLVGELKHSRAIAAWGLMNEPHSLPRQATEGGLSTWAEYSKAAAAAIRTQDRDRPIFVAGDNFSGAQDWDKNNPRRPWISTTLDPIVYEAHYYLDADHSGQYGKTYDAQYASQTPDKIVQKDLDNFFNWLAQANSCGYIGEIGWPQSRDDSTEWDHLGAEAYDYLAKHGMGSTYWATGAWLANYPLNPYRSVTDYSTRDRQTGARIDETIRRRIDPDHWDAQASNTKLGRLQ